MEARKPRFDPFTHNTHHARYYHPMKYRVRTHPVFRERHIRYVVSGVSNTRYTRTLYLVRGIYILW